MEYRVLGKTGLKVSRFGFGGIPIQRIDAIGTKEVLLKLMDMGVNYIDTARAYTVSENYIGEALVGVRDKFILATKSTSLTKEAMAKDIDISLNNLKTDYIDLYQIHNPNMKGLEQILSEGGALEALLEAKNNGKIGHIGLTCHSLEVFKKALELDFVETIMFPYNIVETQGVELIKECREKNIGFIDMKPLAGGAIENARVALRYIAANDDVSVIIPGMADIKEVEINYEALSDQSPLSDEETVEINKIIDELGTNFCRRCNYCAPCAVGISIPSVFLFEGYLSRYGLADWARGRYATLPVKAKDCIECGVCESRCPYNLPIREMMKKASEKFDI